MKLLFVSSNQHKAEEFRALLPSHLDLITLRDIDWTEDIPEPFETFEENAIAKASYVFKRTSMACFADDSGLEVDSLNGKPGVYSARYAGIHADAASNMNKLLGELGNEPNRKARFVAVIAYIDKNENNHLFKGVLNGTIAFKAIGLKGFGYDPVFIPEGFNETLGELSPEVKNTISHRAKAASLFLEHLRK
jgi:XTP/dITP diphosphohydrolase